MDFKVEILKRPTDEDWLLCKKCTLVTVGKDSNKLPTADWVSVHLCRHVHATPFVKTQRNDRQSNYDRGEAPQNQPVDMCWAMNAQELMVIARKRLCTQASPETRQVVAEICRQVEEVNPEFKGLLVPNCVYRGYTCTEFYPCGLAEKLKAKNEKEIKEKEIDKND